MKEFKVSGVIPPVLTPFDANGQPDLDAYGRLLDFLLEHVHGLYPLGTYGSGPLMPKEMRIKLADFVVQKVDGRVPVIMHIGCADTDSAVELARAAQKSGADAVASIVPFYYGYDARCLTEHFSRILESVEIPFYVYNNPGMGNNTITPQILTTLAERGLKGIKDSSFDILTFYAFMRAVKKKDFDFIIGTEALLVAAVVAGADGCVSGVSNTFPELMVELWNAALAGEMEKAMQLQQKVNRIREIMHLSNSVISMHAMLQARGIDGGLPRRPLLPADDGLVARIKAELKALELI
jgi:N-acetylneuraminate lyase/4-hydroxy-tetrahydrodipicolinate synthase